MKKSLNDLVLFGGRPSFNQPLHVGCPNIPNQERLFERFQDILQKRWLTNNGSFVQEFESRIQEMLSVRNCIAICNGTIALEIIIKALDLKGEVIVPSLTFVATAHALQWQNITPIFCDINPQTYNIDPKKVEQMITPRTSAILGVHLWGRACDIKELALIADHYNLKLLFDACHAFGCSYNGEKIGVFGNAEAFSFHATKVINTFEGGAITTNDDELAKKIRLIKNFGFCGYDNVISIGTNGKMSEISAAMGVTGLESLNEFIEANYRNYRQYRNELAEIQGIKVIEYDATDTPNYHYIILEIDENITNISRDIYIKILHSENILARRYFYPGCHKMEPYRSYLPYAGLLLPETEKLVNRLLALPNGITIGSDEISKICSLIRLISLHGLELNKKLH
jgi:dTDP-4-amino-4,6-dideoxygalactose transaminase